MTKEHKNQWILTICFGVLAAFFLAAFIFWTLVPYLQLRIYFGYRNADVTERVLESNFIFSPFTYAQIFIRKDFLISLTRRPMHESDRPLFDKAIANMEELLRRSGFQPYDHVLLGSAYVQKALLAQDSSFLQDAERHYKKAMEFSPKQQKLFYAYGAFLFDQNRNDEAREILGQALALDDRAPVSHFYFALALMRKGEGSYAAALDHFEFFFSSDFPQESAYNFPNPDPGWVRGKDAYETLLRYFYGEKDTERVLGVARRLSELDKVQRAAYQNIVETIENTGQIPKIEFK